eukprot:g908.t1
MPTLAPKDGGGAHLIETYEKLITIDRLEHRTRQEETHQEAYHKLTGKFYVPGPNLLQAASEAAQQPNLVVKAHFSLRSRGVHFPGAANPPWHSTQSPGAVKYPPWHTSKSKSYLRASTRGLEAEREEEHLWSKPMPKDVPQGNTVSSLPMGLRMDMIRAIEVIKDEDTSQARAAVTSYADNVEREMGGIAGQFKEQFDKSAPAAERAYNEPALWHRLPKPAPAPAGKYSFLPKLTSWFTHG